MVANAISIDDDANLMSFTCSHNDDSNFNELHLFT